MSAPDEYGTPEVEDAQALGKTDPPLTWPQVVQNLGFLIIIVSTVVVLVALVLNH